ncbi:MAG: 5-(carboxyamino)imidazole ribonucleotide mutase [Myxococcota bacterium]|jgi:5-(carboxyamino)imidazole ribonucleotide mutase
MTQVLVVTGSDGDWTIMDHCKGMLEQLGVTFEAVTASAHRQADKLHHAMDAFEAGGGQVYICAAGMAAHLAGVVASRTILPVLAVPIASGGLGGMDALLSMVQMPRGVPVGTLAIGKHGAINAAILSAQILALGDEDLAGRLKAYKASLAG